jgi:hypothetical protein
MSKSAFRVFFHGAIHDDRTSRLRGSGLIIKMCLSQKCFEHSKISNDLVQNKKRRTQLFDVTRSPLIEATTLKSPTKRPIDYVSRALQQQTRRLTSFSPSLSTAPRCTPPPDTYPMWKLGMPTKEIIISYLAEVKMIVHRFSESSPRKNMACAIVKKSYFEPKTALSCH